MLSAPRKQENLQITKGREGGSPVRILEQNVRLLPWRIQLLMGQCKPLRLLFQLLKFIGDLFALWVERVSLHQLRFRSVELSLLAQRLQQPQETLCFHFING